MTESLFRTGCVVVAATAAALAVAAATEADGWSTLAILATPSLLVLGTPLALAGMRATRSVIARLVGADGRSLTAREIAACVGLVLLLFALGWSSVRVPVRRGTASSRTAPPEMRYHIREWLRRREVAPIHVRHERPIDEMFPYVADWAEWEYEPMPGWPATVWFWNISGDAAMGGRLEWDDDGRFRTEVRCWGVRVHWPWLVVQNTALLLAAAGVAALLFRARRRRHLGHASSGSAWATSAPREFKA
jgi:hypothetical protein